MNMMKPNEVEALLRAAREEVDAANQGFLRERAANALMANMIVSQEIRIAELETRINELQNQSGTDTDQAEEERATRIEAMITTVSKDVTDVLAKIKQPAPGDQRETEALARIERSLAVMVSTRNITPKSQEIVFDVRRDAVGDVRQVVARKG